MKTIEAEAAVMPFLEAITDIAAKHNIDVHHVSVTGATSLAARNNGRVMTVRLLHTHDFASISYRSGRVAAKLAVREYLRGHGVEASVYMIKAAPK